MDENLVFQNTQSQQAPPVSSPPPPPPEPPNAVGQTIAPILEPQTNQEGFDNQDSKEGPSGFFSSLDFPSIIKVIIGLIILFIVGFLLFNLFFAKTQINTNQKVTLNYWGLWEDKSVMQSVIAEFQKENPNITVNYTKQDMKQYRERLMTRVQNDTGPDIFRFHNTWLPMLSNILLPLPSKTIDKNDFKKWYYPTTQKDLVKNGAIYGIPLEIDTLSLFINTEIFKAASALAPASWDDFAKLARALTVKDENGKIKTAGASLGTFDNVTHAPDIISLLFIQNGADLKNFQGTSQDTIDALNFYTSFTSGEGKVWDETLDDSILAFTKGNLAMYFGYSYDVFTIKAANPNLSFQVFPVPRLPGKNMTIASYWIEGISSKSKNQEAALTFLRFLTKKETQQRLFLEEAKTRLFGEPYSRTDLAESLKSNEMVYPFVSQGNGAVSSFFASNTFDDGLNSQMNSYLGNAIRSILGNTSAQTAAETLSKGVSQVLQQYGQ